MSSKTEDAEVQVVATMAIDPCGSAVGAASPDMDAATGPGALPLANGASDELIWFPAGPELPPLPMVGSRGETKDRISTPWLAGGCLCMIALGGLLASIAIARGMPCLTVGKVPERHARDRVAPVAWCDEGGCGARALVSSRSVSYRAELVDLAHEAGGRGPYHVEARGPMSNGAEPPQVKRQYG